MFLHTTKVGWGMQLLHPLVKKNNLCAKYQIQLT